MENILKAFVTNATADSIAFYAMAFLNNQGYTYSQIRQMREKFELNNIYSELFTVEELETCFSKQSAYFLNLYTFMRESDRFENFVENIFQQNMYNSIFGKYVTSVSIKQSYNRRVFHATSKCKMIKLPYAEENKYFENTGVFAENLEQNVPQYYLMETEWLIKFGMRACINCDITGEMWTIDDV